MYIYIYIYIYINISDKLTLCRTAPGYFSACGSVYLALICVGSFICEQNEHPISPPHFLGKNQSKSIQNWLKINQKSIKNQWKIDLGSVLRPKAVCFAFLVGPGCVLWATRGQHGRNLGPKMEPKSHKNQCQNEDKKSMRLGWAYEVIFSDFGTQLGSKMEGSWASKTHCC